MRQAVFVRLLSISCALFALPAAAIDPSAFAPGVSASQVVDQVEQARVALAASKYDESGKIMDGVLKERAFAELDPKIQQLGLRIAGYAASGRRDALAAHEYFSLVTEFATATADDWAQRALAAVRIETYPDAASALTTIVKRWPGYLKEEAEFSRDLISSTYGGLSRAKNQPEKIALLDVLFSAGYTNEWGTEPSVFWRDLAEAALTRNDAIAAAKYSARVTSGETLVAMRIDNRFAALVAQYPAVFDVRAAAEREVKRLREVVAKNPRSLGPIVQLSYAYYAVGDFDAMRKLADDAITRATKASPKKPAYDDVEDQLNWVYNHKATSLWALGRFDEALTAMAAGAKSGENGASNVSQAINLGFYYNEAGRPNDALAGLEGIDWAHSLSPYGRMQVQFVRYTAYLQLGDHKNSDEVLAWFREHSADSKQTAQDAFVEGGDLDGAAALLIARLHDPTERAEALFGVQDFDQGARTAREREIDARQQELRARPDVAAAIAEVGRREKFAIHVIDF